MDPPVSWWQWATAGLVVAGAVAVFLRQRHVNRRAVRRKLERAQRQSELYEQSNVKRVEKP